MGMDVSGIKPRNETGEYFGASMWSWHPLADYLTTVAPAMIGTIRYLHSNDGDGLPGEAAIHLADLLDAEIASGRTAAYVDNLDTDFLTVDRIRQFSEFSRNSGGFEIW